MGKNKPFSPKVQEILAYLLEKAGIVGKVKINNTKEEEK